MPANAMFQLYLTVNYHTQQFQLAQAVSGNGLTSNLVSFDSSASVGCPAGPSIKGGVIGVIVVGGILAIILIMVLFLWFYKWRDTWNEMETTKKDVRSLAGRMGALDAIVRSQPEVRHGVAAPGCQESIGSLEMADTSNLASTVRNLTVRMDAMEKIASPQQPQPARRSTNPFRNGTGPGERHPSNASEWTELPDTSPLDSIVETQLVRRTT
jgi:hypothetical protein